MTDAREFLARVLELPEVPPDATLGHPPAWDSLAHMRLVLALEEVLGHQLSPVQIVSLAGLADIQALLDDQRRPRTNGPAGG